MDDLTDEPPTDIDPYLVLGLETTATPSEIRSAYKKLALRHHPDKAQPELRRTAHSKFQEIAFAYAVLSDERRRKRYDATGNTSETLDIEGDDFSWSDFFRAQWADSVTGQSLNAFKDKYQHSEEEKRDVLAAYSTSKGKLNQVFKTVMLSNPIDDEQRFRVLIDQAINDGDVESYDAYVNENKKSRNQRHRRARREGIEAQEHAKELGIYESVFGTWDGKPSTKGPTKGSGPGLAELIQQRQKGRTATFMDDLEAKYVGGGKGSAKSRNGKKRKVEEEPSEVVFMKNRRKKQKPRQAEDSEDNEGEDTVSSSSPRPWMEEDEDAIDSKSTAKHLKGRKGRRKGSVTKG